MIAEAVGNLQDSPMPWVGVHGGGDFGILLDVARRLMSVVKYLSEVLQCL